MMGEVFFPVDHMKSPLFLLLGIVHIIILTLILLWFLK